MSEYEVKKGLMGHKVLYNCPACFVPLTSALDKAGTHDSCPDCQKPHVIPGAKEKREMQQAAASAQHQKAEEAERRKADEARKEAQRQVANAPTKSAISTPPPQPSPAVPALARKSAVRRQRFGDGILDAAFILARGVSIIVIVVSLVVLAMLIVLFASAYNDFRPIADKPVRVPNANEFSTYLKSLNQQAPDSSEASNAGSATYLSPVDSFLKKHKLVGGDFRFELLKKKIELVDDEVSSGEFSAFLSELDRFVSKQQNKFAAANWFCSEYSDNFLAREDARRQDGLHNAAVSGRLSMLATSGAAIFGGLISFLILPLLIRIETNTREGGN